MLKNETDKEDGFVFSPALPHPAN